MTHISSDGNKSYQSKIKINRPAIYKTFKSDLFYGMNITSFKVFLQFYQL